ncbi:hypothetical protein BDF22DRAFT_744053 [Syncephalis plumigaleata]|nr:hypothetical protein BDF22DRAFT_744053 [Syncephalis plumigaleata]
MAAPDYRVSKVAVLCKDCGQDVGMYPTRHRCNETDAPPLPATSRDSAHSTHSLAPPSLAPPRPGLSARSNTGGRYAARTAPSSASGGSGTSTTGGTSSLRAGAGRWTRLAGQSAPNSSGQTAPGSSVEDENGNPISGNSGNTSIWGKFRAATNWNTDTSDASGSERGDDDASDAGPPQSTSSGKKLWGKLMGGNADNEKFDEPDSDTSDYEGESHVTRLLKSYYRERYPDAQLPGWLTRPPPELYHPFADRQRERPISTNSSVFSNNHSQVMAQSPGAPASYGHASRHSQDGGSSSSNSAGYGQSLRSPQQASYDSPALGDAKYSRASSGSLPQAPSRRAARPRVTNVRRDAGAFFNDE